MQKIYSLNQPSFIKEYFESEDKLTVKQSCPWPCIVFYIQIVSLFKNMNLETHT